MTLNAWFRLKAGSVIKSARSGDLRRVVEARNGCITLVMVRGGRVRLWAGSRVNIAGQSTTVYVPCDRSNFNVHRY